MKSQILFRKFKILHNPKLNCPQIQLFNHNKGNFDFILVIWNYRTLENQNGKSLWRKLI